MPDIGSVPTGTAAVILSGYTSIQLLSSGHFASVEALPSSTSGDQKKAAKAKKARLFAHQDANVIGHVPDGKGVGHSEGMGDHPQLEIDGLGVSGNSIAGIKSGTFVRFRRLKMLDLSHNELTELVPASFQDLVALQWLRLDHNKLNAIAPNAFKGLEVLTTLEIGHNMLRSLSAAAVAGLESVTSLGVLHNGLEAVGAGFVAALPNLAASFATSSDGGGGGGGGGLTANTNTNTNTNTNPLKCAMAPMETEGLVCSCRFPWKMLHDDDEPGMQCAAKKEAADVCTIGTTKNAEIFLDCRRKQLRRVPANLDPRAHEVLLSSNGISSISALDFVNLPNLNRLYLDNNHVREVEDGALHNITQVLLDGNPSVCNVASGVPSPCSCAEHYAGDGTFCLLRTHASDVCTTSENAGMQAVAAVAGGGAAAADLAVTVDCSDASPPLVLIPAHLPVGTSNLVLRGNSIKVILAEDLAGLHRLEAVSLDQNSVAVVEQGSFEHSKVLGMLSMDGNPTTCEVDNAGGSSCMCGAGLAGTGGAGCSRRVPTSLACRTHTSNYTGSWTADPWSQLVAAASAAAASAGGSLDQGKLSAPGVGGEGTHGAQWEGGGGGEEVASGASEARNEDGGRGGGGGGRSDAGNGVGEEWLFTVVNCDGIQLQAVPTVTEAAATTHLMLDNNGIRYVGLGDFAGLAKLQSLSMERNMITLVATGAFSQLYALRTVSLAHNLLQTLPLGLLPGLQRLDLTSNNVSSINPDAVQAQMLALGPNVALLEGNPSVCTVKKANTLACTCGPGYAGDGSFCIPKPNAADFCTVGAANEDTGELVVDCAGRGLEMVPVGLPVETTTLLLRSNVIKHVGKADFAGLHGLQSLDLAGNRIAWIEDDLFRGLEHLEYLDLSPAPLATTGQCGHADALTELPQDTVVILDGNGGGDANGAAAAVAGAGRKEPAPSTECPRDRSRAARHRIEQRIVGALRELGDDATSLLLTCPLLPHADQYRLHELATHEYNGKGIPCGYCGKLFRDSSFLDRHLDRRHMDRMAKRATVCPNDYCEIVACECVHDCTDEKIEAVRTKCRNTVSACFATMDATAERVVATACDELSCNDLEESVPALFRFFFSLC